MRTGVEPGELLVGGAADPVIDTAVLLAQIDGAFEHYGFAGLPAFHFDGVLVGATAFALERRFPNFSLRGVGVEDDIAIELFAFGFLDRRSLRGVVRSPIAGPRANDFGHLG